MPDTSLESSGLFQLNVLIWASFAQPPDAPVAPVLRNVGHELLSIEQPLKAGLLERSSIEIAEPEVSAEPVADVVLERRDPARAVVIECKAQSFGLDGPQSDHARKQARGFLVAVANITGRGLAGIDEAEVCYVVPSAHVAAMAQTLADLASEVTSAGLAAGDAGALGIRIADDGVYLGCQEPPGGTAQLPMLLRPDHRVLELSPGDDPRPLYIVPWMPESDEIDRQAFQEKLRTQVLSHLGRAAFPGLTLAFDDLLDEVSRGVFRRWRDRSSFTGTIYPAVASILRNLLGSSDAVRFGRDRVAIRLEDEATREKLIEHVRGEELPETPPEGVQTPLPEDDEGTSA